MKFIDRLVIYIETKGISLNAFDKSIGTANGYIGKQIKNSASIGADIIEKIVSVYTDLSIEWLISGKGEMLKAYSNQEAISFVNEEKPINCKFCREKDKVIEAQGKTITTQQKYILCLENELEQKKPGETGQKRKVG